MRTAMKKKNNNSEDKATKKRQEIAKVTRNSNSNESSNEK